MNKVSTEIDSFSVFTSVEEALKMTKTAGFDCFNFDLCHIMDFDFQKDKVVKQKHPLATRKYRKYLTNLKNFADNLGIYCNQTHAPFPIYDKKILKSQKKAVKATSYIGAKIMVVHPDNFKTVDENAVLIKRIAKFAKKYNIKIAVENVFNWSGTHAIYCAGSTPNSLIELINKIGEENVGACLDVGHANIMGNLGNSVDFINKLGDKLIATHIHDNNLTNDRHQIPFSDSINFEEIAKALKDNSYKGELTLEAIYYYKKNSKKGQEMVNDLYESVMKINHLMND